MNLLSLKLKIALVLLFSVAPVEADCFDEAGAKYNINPNLIRAIAYTESKFDADAQNCRNTDGSCDTGFMQINEWWLPKLVQFGITKKDLSDPCLSVHVGTWILATNFKTHGDSWNSVGAYNAGFSKKNQAVRDKYVLLVKSNFEFFESKFPN